MKTFASLLLILLAFCVGCGTEADPSFFLDILKDPADATPIIECLEEPPINDDKTLTFTLNKQCLVDLSNPSAVIETTPMEQSQLSDQPLPEHAHIPLKLMSPDAIAAEYGEQFTYLPVPVSIPQQHIDEQSGIMWVGYGFEPHENGTIFSPKALSVFLTAEAALHSEQYQLLLDYFTEWNANNPDQRHNGWANIVPGFIDYDGIFLNVHFQIATKEEAYSFLTSAVESGEFSSQFKIIKNEVKSDGIIHQKWVNIGPIAILSFWDSLIFSDDDPNDITWYEIWVYAKNTGELDPDWAVEETLSQPFIVIE